MLNKLKWNNQTKTNKSSTRLKARAIVAVAKS